MGTTKLAVNLLFRDFKKNIFYCGSLLFSSAIIFVFFNVMSNPVYGGVDSFSSSTNTFAGVLSIIVVIIAMMMVFFANSFYLIGKAKELAITTISGGSVTNLAGFLFVQNFIIMLVAIPTGILLGYFINPFINSIVYNSMGVSANPWDIFPIGVTYTIISIVTEIVWVVIVDTGYAYRTSLLDLLSAEKTMETRKKNTLKISLLVYVILFVVPIYMLLSSEANFEVFIVWVVVASPGITGILEFVIPEMLVKIQRKYSLNKKYSLVALGNFNHSIKKSGTLVIMSIISFSFLVSFMCQYIDQPNYLVLIIMAYIVLVFLMAISSIYKIIVEATLRANSFKHLKMLGYTIKEIKKMIQIEIIGIWSVIVLFPLIYVGIIFFKFIQATIVTSLFALNIISIYVVVFTICCLVAYFTYVKLVLSGRDR